MSSKNVHVDSAADLNDLVNHIYPELKRRARWLMSGERTGHTFGPSGSELVQRMMEKVLSTGGYVFRAAPTEEALIRNLTRQMRFILVEYARRTKAAKRPDPARRGSLEDNLFLLASPIVNTDRILSVDEVLTHLASKDPEAAQTIELRFFAGLTNAEAASAMSISVPRFRRLLADATAVMRIVLTTPQPRPKTS